MKNSSAIIVHLKRRKKIASSFIRKMKSLLFLFFFRLHVTKLSSKKWFKLDLNIYSRKVFYLIWRVHFDIFDETNNTEWEYNFSAHTHIYFVWYCTFTCSIFFLKRSQNLNIPISLQIKIFMTSYPSRKQWVKFQQKKISCTDFAGHVERYQTIYQIIEAK